jgi:hypothetical protein
MNVARRDFLANNKRRRAMEAKLAKLAGAPPAEINAFVKRELIAVQTGGDESSLALDARGWARVLDELAGRLGAFGPAPRPPDVSDASGVSRASGRPGASDGFGRSNRRLRQRAAAGTLPTAAQKHVIRRLAGKIGMNENDLETMCARRWHWRRPTTRRRAAALLEALKSMVCVQCRLRDRAALLDAKTLTERERRFRTEFLRQEKANRLAAGAILWMVDLCTARDCPRAPEERSKD